MTEINRKPQNTNTLTSSSGVVSGWDLRKGPLGKLTLTEHTVVRRPTNAVPGEHFSLQVEQDSTGGWNIDFYNITVALASVGCSIAVGTGDDMVISFSSAQDLSNVSVGDSALISGFTTGVNNGNFFIVTAVSDASDTITISNPNGGVAGTSQTINIQCNDYWIDRQFDQCYWLPYEANTRHLYKIFYTGEHYIPETFFDLRHAFSSAPSARRRLFRDDDFAGSSIESTLDWATTSSGGSTDVTSVGATSEHPGIARLNVTAGTANNYVFIRTSTSSIVVGSNRSCLETLIKLPALSTVTEDFVITIGVAGDNNDLDPNHQYGFVYEGYQGGTGSPNWQFVSQNGSGNRTQVDTGVPVVAATWTRLRVGTDLTGGFSFVNDINVGYIATNFPTGDQTGLRLGIRRQNVIGAATQYFDIDYVVPRMQFVNLR